VKHSYAAGKWFASSCGMVALTLVTIHPSTGKVGVLGNSHWAGARGQSGVKARYL
jgi:hypothetical protein